MLTSRVISVQDAFSYIFLKLMLFQNVLIKTHLGFYLLQASDNIRNSIWDDCSGED